MTEKEKPEDPQQRIRDLEQALAEARVQIESLQEKEKRLSLIIETFQDVTLRRQAEEGRKHSEKRFRTLLNFVPYPLVVFTLEGNVSYVNQGFTKTFGWTLPELEGKQIPYVPPGYEEEHKQRIKQLYEEKVLYRHESKRLTKDGHILDVAIRATMYYEEEGHPAGELVIFRNITKDKKMARTNEALLRISMALPKYADLEILLDYINEEVKTLLETEGCVVILVDDVKKDFYIPAAAFDRNATEQRVKEHRFSMDELISGRVIRTGEPLIVSDTFANKELHRKRDQKLGYRTRNLLIVPLKSANRIIGTLCATNKKQGDFDHSDLDLLNMIAGTVALSVENAKFSKELKNAYQEVAALNRAKDKAINHLSHELKTPVAVALGALKILIRKLAALPDRHWESTIAMAQRNLNRIVDIQYEVDDIMRGRTQELQETYSLNLAQWSDLIESIVDEETGEKELAGRIQKRIHQIFNAKELTPKRILLEPFIKERLSVLKPHFAHREVEIVLHLELVPPIFIPEEILQKVFDGLIKNAVENTPAEGRIEISLARQGAGAGLKIRDEGVGILPETQKRIFEGFFPARDTMLYSTKQPFDFNAGGKGADLLRMKIFSEQYHFNIEMSSQRCRYLPQEIDLCPGRISRCRHCKQKEDCGQSGGTVFSLYFSPAIKGE